MKWTPSFAVLIALLLNASATGDEKETANKLPENVVKTLEKSKELTIYSLDGLSDKKDDWHGAKVLGKTTIKGDDVKKLVTELAKSVEEGNRPARCFIPRHGVRGTSDDAGFDLVICFECGWVYVYTDKSDKPQTFMITDSTQAKLNKILTDAKIPLAAPPKKPAPNPQ
jgi:hypothetical protein